MYRQHNSIVVLTVLVFLIVECLLPIVYVRHTLHKYHSYLIKQDTQRSYNVKLRRVRSTIIAFQKQ